MTTRPFADPEIRFVETERIDEGEDVDAYLQHIYVLDVPNPKGDVVIIDLLYAGERYGHIAIYGGMDDNSPGDVEVELERA